MRAAIIAAERREQMVTAGESFIAETVFSHPSKVDFVRDAMAAGYDVRLQIILVPEELTVARVRTRVANGGHDVPEDRIRARYERLWPLVVEAISAASEVTIYDNSSVTSPYRVLARFMGGQLVTEPVAPWPRWAPAELAQAAGRT